MTQAENELHGPMIMWLSILPGGKLWLLFFCGESLSVSRQFRELGPYQKCGIQLLCPRPVFFDWRLDPTLPSGDQLPFLCCLGTYIYVAKFPAVIVFILLHLFACHSITISDYPETQAFESRFLINLANT